MVNGLLQRQGCELLDESPLGLSGSVLKWIAWQLLHSLKALHEEQVCHGRVCPVSISVQIATAHGGYVCCPAVLKLQGRSAAAAGICSPLELGSTWPAESYCRAPEQLLGQQGASSAADIWAFGCTLAELATGQPLFPGATPADQLRRIQRLMGPLPAAHTSTATNAAGSTCSSVADPKSSRHLLRQRLEPALLVAASAAASGGGGGDDSGAHVHGSSDGVPLLLDLIAACLQLHPSSRPSCSQLLAMPYFADVPAAAINLGLPFQSMQLATFSDSHAPPPPPPPPPPPVRSAPPLLPSSPSALPSRHLSVGGGVTSSMDAGNAGAGACVPAASAVVHGGGGGTGGATAPNCRQALSSRRYTSEKLLRPTYASTLIPSDSGAACAAANAAVTASGGGGGHPLQRGMRPLRQSEGAAFERGINAARLALQQLQDQDQHRPVALSAGGGLAGALQARPRRRASVHSVQYDSVGQQGQLSGGGGAASVSYGASAGCSPLVGGLSTGGGRAAAGDRPMGHRPAQAWDLSGSRASYAPAGTEGPMSRQSCDDVASGGAVGQGLRLGLGLGGEPTGLRRTVTPGRYFLGALAAMASEDRPATAACAATAPVSPAMPAAHPQQQSPPALELQEQQQGPLLPQLPGAAPVPAQAPQQQPVSSRPRGRGEHEARWQQHAPAALQLPSPPPSTHIVQLPSSRGSEHPRQPPRAPSSSQLSSFPVGVSPCPSPLAASAPAQDPLQLANSRPSPSTTPSAPRHPSGDASPSPDQPAHPVPRQAALHPLLPPISPPTPVSAAAPPPPALGTIAATSAMLEAFLQDSAALAAEMASGYRITRESSVDAGALSSVPSEADLDPVLSFAPGLGEVRATAPGPAPAVPAATKTTTTTTATIGGVPPLQQSPSPLPRRSSRQRALSSHNQPSLTADDEGPLPRLIGVLQRELYTQQQQQQQYGSYAGALSQGPPYALQSPGVSSRAAHTGPGSTAPASSAGASVGPLLGRASLTSGAPPHIASTTGSAGLNAMSAPLALINGQHSTYPVAGAPAGTRPVRALSQGAGLGYVHGMAEHMGSGVLRAVSEVEESDGSLPVLPEIVSSAGTPTWGVRQGGSTAQGEEGGGAGAGGYAPLGSFSGPAVHHGAQAGQLRGVAGGREHPGAGREGGPGAGAGVVRQRLGRMSSVGCDVEGNEGCRDGLGELGNGMQGRERGPMGLARRARERFRRYFSEDGSGAGEPPAVQLPAAPMPPPSRAARGLLAAGSSGGGAGGAAGPGGAELGGVDGGAVGAANGVRVGPSRRRSRSTSGMGERRDVGASDDGGSDADEMYVSPVATQQQLSGGAVAPGAAAALLRRSDGGARPGPLQVMQSLARVFRRGRGVRPRMAPAGATAPGGVMPPDVQQQQPRRSAAPRQTE